MFARKKSITVMGLDINPNSDNARKLAADLGQLQSKIFRKTRAEHFLDQDKNEGHLNFELHKFGSAVRLAIKNDLRANPLQSFVEFYVDLLSACHKDKNYELAAVVYAGINDAIVRDEVKVEIGQYELPVEDSEVQRVRGKLRGELEKLKKWKDIEGIMLPLPEQAKVLYADYKNRKVKFVPSIDAFMKFIAIRLENAERLYYVDDLAIEIKLHRLMQMKTEIGHELFFIRSIIEECHPKICDLNFPQLQKLFGASLKLNLQDAKKLASDMLDDILRIPKLKAFLPREAVIYQEEDEQVAVPILAVSPRGRITPKTTPRQGLFSEGEYLAAASPRIERSESFATPCQGSDETDSPRSESIAVAVSPTERSESCASPFPGSDEHELDSRRCDSPGM